MWTAQLLRRFLSSICDFVRVNFISENIRACILVKFTTLMSEIPSFMTLPGSVFFVVVVVVCLLGVAAVFISCTSDTDHCRDADTGTSQFTALDQNNAAMQEVAKSALNVKFYVHDGKSAL